MFGAALLLYFFQIVNHGGQYQVVNGRSQPIEQERGHEWTDETTRSVAVDGDSQSAEYQQHELAKRFNAVMNALTDFASSYNAGVVNARKAKAVRKALRELEKSDWFRPVKGE